MPRQPLNSQEIVRLLSMLKDSTPNYPIDLMNARKAAFLIQAVAIKLDGNGLSGKGGGDGGIGGSGGSGVLGGMSTAQTILLQAVIGVWVIAAMLTAAYVFRGQIIDLLQDNGIVVETTQVPSSEPTVPATILPATEVPTTEFAPTPTTGDLQVFEATPDGSSNIQNTPYGSKQNPGLHLGQTPGTPDTPDQDKPDKPDNPNKPKKPK